MSPAISDPDQPAPSGQPAPGESTADALPAPAGQPTQAEYPGQPPYVAYPGHPTYPDPPSSAGEPDGSPNRDAVIALAGVVLITLLGAPLGLLWSALSPTVPFVKADEGAYTADPQPEGFIAADGWFSLLGLGFGILAAVGVWLVLRRQRGPLGLLVGMVGCFGAALVAWKLGRQIGLADFEHLLATAPPGTHLDKPADLRAGGIERWRGLLPVPKGDLLLPGFGAVVTYTLLAGWSRWPSLRPEPEPVLPPGFPPVSWDSTAPPVPQAAPEPPGPDEAAPPRD